MAGRVQHVEYIDISFSGLRYEVRIRELNERTFSWELHEKARGGHAELGSFIGGGASRNVRAALRAAVEFAWDQTHVIATE